MDYNIFKCTCVSEFQDEMYGKGMRVFNPTGKGTSQGSGFRCTVCGKTLGSGTVKKKK